MQGASLNLPFNADPPVRRHGRKSKAAQADFRRVFFAASAGQAHSNHLFLLPHPLLYHHKSTTAFCHEYGLAFKVNITTKDNGAGVFNEICRVAKQSIREKLNIEWEYDQIVGPVTYATLSLLEPF